MKTFLKSSNKMYDLVKTIAIAYLMLISLHTAAQISHGGMPLSFSKPDLQEVKFKKMPIVDVETLLAEARIRDSLKDQPYRFGYNIDVNFNFQNSGVLDYLDDGTKIWRLGILSSNAVSINLLFDQFRLPEGAKLFIYTNNLTHFLGSFTSENNREDRNFATVPLPGENIIIEYNEPKNVEFSGEFNLIRVTHGFRGMSIFQKGFGDSGDCNINVACPEADSWGDQIRAAVMILRGGSDWCSGSLINNTSNDGTPYVLTANHCFFPNPADVLVVFNWESETCENPSTAPPMNQSINGATTRARWADSDFWLLELDETPPNGFNTYYSGWNRTTNAELMQTVVGIHHPQSDIKKFSWSTGGVTTSGYSGDTGSGETHWRVGSWSGGTTTEGGSSGSPLYDENSRIIGQLHGGFAACGNTLPDWYGKLGISWNGGGTDESRLSNWLDPTGSGVMVLDGFNPNIQSSVEIAICLDRSGSMQGGYMTAAKNASKTFVDMMQFNDYLAVTSFAASASVNYPFTQLVDEQDKTNAKNAINSIATGGWTSIGSGMQKSQSELNKGNTDQTQAMLLLSDGYENEPPYVSNVIPTIPGNTDIYTIALGPDSDQTLLNNIAVQTGGFYSYAPGASRLNLIYNSIRAKVTGQEVYASFTESLDQGQTQNHNVFVDGGTTFVIFSLTWSGDELDIELTDPNGLVIDENSSDPNVSYTFGPSYKTFSITNPESGEYVVNILNPNKARQSTNYNFVVSGESTLNMSVTFDKSIYGLNEPIQVVADITDGTLPVTGASITAEVTVPAKADFIPKGLISKEEPEPDESLIKDENGNYYDEKGELRYEKATLVLNDNGDGTYSNSFTNTNVQGSYSFDIFASGIAPLSGDFTRIDNQSTNVTTNQSIVVTQPQTGALWESGTSQTVQWSTTNISGNVNIYLSTDGGSNYNIPLALDTPDVGTLAVLVPNIPSDVCRIKVESVDNSSISGINPGNFSITAPPCTQAVDISENWSLISSYVIPNDPELELVFEDISDNLLIMLSKSGIFWPSQNINTLGEWNAVEGYKIKMAEQAMLCMNGDITEIETVNLIQGANYLPVLSQNNVVATDIFNQIEDELIFAFDLDGAIYWPEGGLFDLQVLEPGKAYLLLLNAEASVTFGDPDSGKAITGNKVRTIENSPWKVANTGNAHLISIYSSAVEGMNFGDIIGVFTSDGLCVGLTQYIGESGNLPLVVYGNDFTTEQINGLVEGEAITLKVSSLKAATSLEDHSLSNLAVYPNPNTGLFTVTGINEPVVIHVLNTSGQMIESLTTNQSIEINLSNLAKGIYYLKVISEQDVRIEKIIIK